ncbi:MAG: tetratricopeptide repeat protein [Bacteroidia bacterium]
MKKISIMLVMGGMLHNVVAQLPAYTDVSRYYQEGWEFFQKGQYENALRSFDYYLESQGLVNNTHIFHPAATTKNAGYAQNDTRAFARYYQAIATYYLGKEEAESQLRNFIQSYPENSNKGYANYCLGKLLFQSFHYKECVEPFASAAKQGVFTENETHDMNFALGYSNFMQADYANADRYFTRLTQRKNPYQAQATYYHGLIAYHDEKFEEALTAFTQIENSPSYHKELQVLKANSLMKLRRYEELYQLADAIEKEGNMETQDPQVFFIVANTSYDRKDYAKASHYFDLYKSAGNTLIRPALLRHAYSYFFQEDYEKATPIFESVLTENDTLSQYASYYMGFCYLQQEKLEEARYAYMNASNTENRKSNEDMTQDALYQYAKLCFSTQYRDEAFIALTKIEKNYPKAPYIGEVREMIGELYLISQNYPDAIAYFKSTPLTSQRAKLAYQTVSYYYGLEKTGIRDYETAEPHLKYASSSQSDQNIAHAARFWLAEGKFQQGLYNDAIAHYQQYQSQYGSNKHEYYALSEYGLAWSKFKLKKYSEALGNFEDFIALYDKNKSNEQEKLVDAHLRAGDCLFMTRQYVKATKHYDDAMKKGFMQSDYAMYQTAEGAYRLGKYDDAIKRFVQLINVSSYKDSDLRDNALDRVSDIYLTWKKDPGKSAVYAKMLVDDYPRNQLAPAAYNRLAQASFEAEKPDEAIRYYQKILNDFTYDTENCQIALDNLSSIMEPDEYDKILRAYRSKNPKSSEQLNELTLKTAQDRYYSKSYASAIELLNDFLADNPSGKNYFEALYFRAESYKLTGKFEKAFEDYEKVYNTANEYTSKSLDAAAKLKFAQSDFEGSKQLYMMLENLAQRIENKVNAKFGIARSMVALLDYLGAIKQLTEITENVEADKTAKTKANVQLGNCYLVLKKYEEAIAILKPVAADNRDNSGAEAQYLWVKTYYEQEKYKESIDAAKFMRNNFPDSEWKAKSFLMVAESNVKLNNNYQAKAVLESIMQDDRYPEVVKMANARLEELKKLTP